MSERKPPGESWESFAERKIREAQAEGQFDNLPGFGRPIPGIDAPLDENWWIKEKLKREQIVALPPILEMRLEVEKALAELDELKSEPAVRKRLQELNVKIEQAHFSHISGPADGIAPLDIDRLAAEWRRRAEERAKQ